MTQEDENMEKYLQSSPLSSGGGGVGSLSYSPGSCSQFIAFVRMRSSYVCLWRDKTRDGAKERAIFQGTGTHITFFDKVLPDLFDSVLPQQSISSCPCPLICFPKRHIVSYVIQVRVRIQHPDMISLPLPCYLGKLLLCFLPIIVVAAPRVI